MIDKLTYKSFEGANSRFEEILTSEKHNKLICAMVERIFDESKKIGEGRTAKVFPDTFTQGVCHKVIYDKELLFNDVDEEAEYLDGLTSIDSKARVPKPVMHVFASVTEMVDDKPFKKTQQVLMLEQIEGFSLKDVVEEKAILPEDFDKQVFMEALRDFVEKMHEKKIYHRDLHEGNVMIDTTTNMPVVIDFGHAGKKVQTDEDMYRVPSEDPRVTNFNRVGIQLFLNDDEQLLKIEDLIDSLVDKRETK
jgi:serine/threonine protein kinase